MTVRNDDAATHTVTAVACDKVFDTGDIDPGATRTFTAPNSAGSYSYICEIHQFMSGTLTVGFMIGPYRPYLAHHPNVDISRGNLVVTSPLEGFTTRLKIRGYFGAALAAPVWIHQSWRFVSPGLHRHERRYAAGFAAAAGVAPLFSPSRYFGLYALACLVFGAVFTYPVFLVALELLGVVSSAKLRSFRRYAIVILCTVAAVITPSGDPFSFLALAAPMVAFYEASILVGRVLHK